MSATIATIAPAQSPEQKLVAIESDGHVTKSRSIERMIIDPKTGDLLLETTLSPKIGKHQVKGSTLETPSYGQAFQLRLTYHKLRTSLQRPGEWIHDFVYHNISIQFPDAYVVTSRAGQRSC